MANQSFQSVPPNIEDPVVLRRFLARLLEQIDIAFGNRGGEDSSYVEQRALISSADSLSKQLEKAQATLDQAIQSLADTLGQDTQDILEQLEELSNTLTLVTDRVTALENYSAIKGFIAKFTVDGSNNLVYTSAYNINDLASSRTGVGVYRFTLAQATYFTENVITNSTVSVDTLIAPTATSETFVVELVEAGTDTFDIKVYEVVLNVSNILVKQAYDLLPGDIINLVGVFNTPNSSLPGA